MGDRPQAQNHLGDTSGVWAHGPRPFPVLMPIAASHGAFGAQLLGTHSGNAVMIGDRMETDIVAALEAGVDRSYSPPGRSPT
ncbi:MAG TPA: HAD hydrolase-like protein [Acidimicrobiales bacterium]|nr:HAD hydrolase-like protein [Acidimicrobiales bacterium]